MILQNVWSEVLRCVSRWELLQQLRSGGPTDALLFSPPPPESPASNPLMKLRDRLLMRTPAPSRHFGGAHMTSVCQICVLCLSRADCMHPAVSFYHPVHAKQDVLHLIVLCAVYLPARQCIGPRRSALSSSLVVGLQVQMVVWLTASHPSMMHPCTILGAEARARMQQSLLHPLMQSWQRSTSKS